MGTNIQAHYYVIVYSKGKVHQVNKEFRDFIRTIDLLGVWRDREMARKWKNSGWKKHTILYSGNEDNEHQARLAVLKEDNCKNLWSNENLWEDYSRKFLSTLSETSTIVCFAPAEDVEEEEKDLFYQQLQQIIEQVPRHNMLLLIGDLNAKSGSCN